MLQLYHYQQLFTSKHPLLFPIPLWVLVLHKVFGENLAPTDCE